MRRCLVLAGLLALGVAGCSKSGEGADSEKVAKLEKRVAKLEKAQKEVDEMRDFLRPIMAQQKAQAKQKAATEPDPNVRFAVDVTGDAFNGPAGAPVTIVEAFDFA